MKIPKAEHRPEILEAYKQVFLAIPSIISVRTNTEAGNIVINYDTKREAEFHQHFDTSCAEHNMSVNLSLPGNEFKEMTKKIEAEAEFLAERSHFVRVTVDFFKGLDYQIKVVTGNAIDLKILLAGGLAVATFVEIGAEAATPMWVTLALFGVNHFIEMKQEPLHAPLANSASLK